MKVTDKDREASDALAAHVGLTLATREREHFAQAIATAREEGRAEEREACAELVRTWGQDHECLQPMFGPMAAAIRARGED